MSQENQNEAKVEQKCNFTLLCVLVIISLLFSVSALTLSILSFKGVGAAAGAEGKKVVISKQYDKGRSLDKAIAAKKPMIVFFYTDWCGFCQRFAPTFDKVTKDSKIKKNFAIAYVNCENQENHKWVEEYGIQAYPTVYVVKEDGSKVQLDNNTFFNEDSKEVISDRAMEIIGDDDKEADD